jgi:hypothetical protein
VLRDSSHRTLQPEPLRYQLANDKRDEGNDQGHADEAQYAGESGRHAQAHQSLFGLITQRDSTEGARQQCGKRDPDLDGGQEAVRVLDQAGHGLAPAAPLRHCPHLTFAQRDQRDLRCHEARFEQDQRQHDGDVEQR